MNTILYRNSLFPTYEKIKTHYEMLAKRSRTYVGSTKAVRIRRRMNNCVVYPEHTMIPDGMPKPTSNYIVRLYNTDILVYRPDNTAVVNTGGYLTMTTRERICAACGVQIGSCSGIQARLYRLWMTEAREGKARVGIHRTVPFVDGIVIRLGDGEVMNPEIIPSDVRSHELRPTAQARKDFQKKWNPIAERMKFFINIGDWADRVRVADRPIPFRGANGVAGLIRDGEQIDEEYLLGALLGTRHLSSWLIRASSSEEITAELRKRIPKLRAMVQVEYARVIGQLENIGGGVLGGGYYVKEE